MKKIAQVLAALIALAGMLGCGGSAPVYEGKDYHVRITIGDEIPDEEWKKAKQLDWNQVLLPVGKGAGFAGYKIGEAGEYGIIFYGRTGEKDFSRAAGYDMILKFDIQDNGWIIANSEQFVGKDESVVEVVLHRPGYVPPPPMDMGVVSDMGPSPDMFMCPPGEALCGGACVNLQSSGANCGKCGMMCPQGQMCLMGACAQNCGSLDTCGASCVNLKSDLKNCGSCGMVCATPANATPACAAGVCGRGACNMGFASCDNDESNGCEVTLAIDPDNCGACANKCPLPPNAGRFCAAGKCGFMCLNGTTGCGGVCLDLSTDSANCGACGKKCAMGEMCVMGTCKAGQPPPDLAMPPQPNGAPCAAGPDCQSGNCYKLFCAVPTCGNGQQDGNESDKDCGGPMKECSPRCIVGKNCYANGDCLSNKCVGTCQQ